MYITKSLQKNNFNDFYVKKKILIVQIFYNLQDSPTFLSEERLVNLVRRSECFVGLSIFFLVVYGGAHADTNLCYPYDIFCQVEGIKQWFSFTNIIVLLC